MLAGSLRGGWRAGGGHATAVAQRHARAVGGRTCSTEYSAPFPQSCTLSARSGQSAAISQGACAQGRPPASMRAWPAEQPAAPAADTIGVTKAATAMSMALWWLAPVTWANPKIMLPFDGGPARGGGTGLELAPGRGGVGRARGGVAQLPVRAGPAPGTLVSRAEISSFVCQAGGSLYLVRSASVHPKAAQALKAFRKYAFSEIQNRGLEKRIF